MTQRNMFAAFQRNQSARGANLVRQGTGHGLPLPGAKKPPLGSPSPATRQAPEKMSPKSDKDSGNPVFSRAKTSGASGGHPSAGSLNDGRDGAKPNSPSSGRIGDKKISKSKSK